MIAKNGDSVYVSRRTRDWLKFKCSQEQEFVIGGYTDPRGSRIGFGALLLGYYQGRKLVYAGKVGTGFDDDIATTPEQDAGANWRRRLARSTVMGCRAAASIG